MILELEELEEEEEDGLTAMSPSIISELEYFCFRDWNIFHLYGVDCHLTMSKKIKRRKKPTFRLLRNILFTTVPVLLWVEIKNLLREGEFESCVAPHTVAGIGRFWMTLTLSIIYLSIFGFSGWNGKIFFCIGFVFYLNHPGELRTVMVLQNFDDDLLMRAKTLICLSTMDTIYVFSWNTVRMIL